MSVASDHAGTVVLLVLVPFAKPTGNQVLRAAVITGSLDVGVGLVVIVQWLPVSIGGAVIKPLLIISITAMHDRNFSICIFSALYYIAWINLDTRHLCG